MNFEDLKKEIFKNENFKKEYYRNDNIAFEIAQMVSQLRAMKGITQKELAEKIDTKQSSISRIESGKKLPSLSILVDIAKAVGTTLLSPRFALIEESNNVPDYFKRNRSVQLLSSFSNFDIESNNIYLKAQELVNESYKTSSSDLTSQVISFVDVQQKYKIRTT